VQEGRGGLRAGVARVLALEAGPLVEVVAPVEAAVAERAVLEVNELHGGRGARLRALVSLLRAQQPRRRRQRARSNMRRQSPARASIPAPRTLA